MVKAKSVIIYILSVTAVLMLFASFDAEFYFPYSNKLNISDQTMYYAFTSQTDKLTIKQQDADTPEVKAESYHLNDESSFIREYKLILYYLSYLEYPSSNIMDAAMQTAVIKYQQAKDMEATGILDSKTMLMLNAEPLEYRQGQKGDAILKYQQILKQLGYISEETEINGNFGSETTNAVSQYQINNKIAVTGTLNNATQVSLSRDASEQVPANQQ